MPNEEDDLARHVELVEEPAQAKPTGLPQHEAPPRVTPKPVDRPLSATAPHVTPRAVGGAAPYSSPSELPRASGGSSWGAIEGCGCWTFKAILVLGTIAVLWWSASAYLDRTAAEDAAVANDIAIDACAPQIEALQTRIEHLEARADEAEADRAQLQSTLEDLDYRIEEASSRRRGW
jgi:hypothetical protein